MALEEPLPVMEKVDGKRPELASMPAGVKYLLFTETLIRLTVKGTQIMLALFLFDHLRLSENISTELVHVFLTVMDMSPLIGAFLSDGYLEKYHTVLYFEFLNLAGSAILIVGAVPGVGTGWRITTLSCTAIGLLFVAVGAGGVRPCIAAFGGDQVYFLISKGEDRDRLRRQFFSLFYIALNSGSFLSCVISPLLRTFGSYFLMFSTLCLYMGASVLVFWLGRVHYVHGPVTENVFLKVGTIIVDALKFQISKRAPRTASGFTGGSEHGQRENLLSPDEIVDDDRQYTIVSDAKYHWLDGAKLNHDAPAVEDVKTLLRVLVLFTAVPVFWALFDQQFSKWVFQARLLNCKVSWLGGFVLQPDQLPGLNPLLVLIMIPIFDHAIYPFFTKLKIPLSPLSKIVIGMLLAVLAFLTSGVLQLAMDNTFRSPSTGQTPSTSGSTAGMRNSGSGGFLNTLPRNLSESSSSLLTVNAFMDFQDDSTPAKLSVLWQLPQYILITAGEIMINITGLEFAYSQAPSSMKSVVQGAWNCTSSIGNMLTFAVVAIIGERFSKANEYFVFAGGCAAAACLILWTSHGYVDSQATVPAHPDPMLAETTMVA